MKYKDFDNYHNETCHCHYCKKWHSQPARPSFSPYPYPKPIEGVAGSRGAKRFDDYVDQRGVREGFESQGFQEHFDSNGPQNLQDFIDSVEPQDFQEHFDSNGPQSLQEFIDSVELQEFQEHFDSNEPQSLQEFIDSIEPQEFQEHFDSNEPQSLQEVVSTIGAIEDISSIEDTESPTVVNYATYSLVNAASFVAGDKITFNLPINQEGFSLGSDLATITLPNSTLYLISLSIYQPTVDANEPSICIISNGKVINPQLQVKISSGNGVSATWIQPLPANSKLSLYNMFGDFSVPQTPDTQISFTIASLN